MLNHIIVPLDGSELAEKALEAMRQLVNTETKITLLAAVDPPEYVSYSMYGTQPSPSQTIISSVDYQTISDDMLNQSKAYLGRIAEDLRREGYKVQVSVEMGLPAEVIIDTAENLEASAIVMSTHGRSGLSRWILGSITSKVLSAAPCPVYVVPPERAKKEP